MPLFGINLGKFLLAIQGTKTITLVKTTPGTRTPGNLTGGSNPTTATHYAKGWIEGSRLSFMPDSLVEFGNVYVAILAESIPGILPEAGDTISIEEISGATIVWVDQDPARAIFWVRVKSVEV